MTEQDISSAIKAEFGDAVMTVVNPPDEAEIRKKYYGAKMPENIERPRPLPSGPKVCGWIEIQPERILDVLRWLKTTPGIEMDFPHSISGVDYKAGEPLGLTYHLTSIRHKHWVAIKVTLPRDNPVVASCVGIFPGMDWHEREAFDLLGIRFSGHPNMRRILCAEDWEGYPLRKDYEFPETYHGIPTGKEIRWNS